MNPIFKWEYWHGRLSPVIEFAPLGSEGQRLAELREVPGTRRHISAAQAALSLNVLANRYPVGAPT